MRRLLIGLCLIFIFASCEKTNSLVGKTFAAFGYHVDEMNAGIIHIDGYDAYYVYRFVDEARAERTTRKYSAKGEVIGEIESCTYTYEYPIIEITYIPSYSDKEITVQGEFLDKNTFRINKSDYYLQ